MGAKKKLALPLQYRIGRDPLLSSSNVINMYAVKNDSAQQGFMLVPASGLANPVTLGDGPIRAQFVFDGLRYVVSGDEFYSISAAGVATLIDTLGTTTGYVGFAMNQTQIILVDGADAYVWDTSSTTFTTVSFTFTVAPVDVTYLDGSFIIIDGDTNSFYYSALNDGTTWVTSGNPNRLSVTTRNAKGVAIRALKRRIFVMCDTVTEVWVSVGDVDFPFRRQNNSVYEHGCASAATVQEGFEMMFYVSQNIDGAVAVMMTTGSAQPTKISHHELDIFLDNADENDSVAFLYRENGLIFYQLTFKTDNKTFLYCLNTQLWSELRLPGGGAHPAALHAYYNQVHYVGSYTTNQIWQLSYQFFTYDTSLLEPVLVLDPIYDNQNHRKVVINEIQLSVVTGLPEATLANRANYPQLNTLVENNETPYIFIEMSRDGGRTFKTVRQVPMGTAGDYQRLVVARNFGEQGRRCVIRLRYPYFTQFYIEGAYVDYEFID